MATLFIGLAVAPQPITFGRSGKKETTGQPGEIPSVVPRV